LLNHSSAQEIEFTQHLKEIGTAQLRQLEIIQGNARCGSHAGWKDIAQIVPGLVKRTLQGKIDFFSSLMIISGGKRE
jgi:hypothetical protein